MALNVVVLMGRLGRDPELQRSASGMEYLRFSLAVDRIPGKDRQRVTDWIRCTAFGKTAVTMANYLHKGSMIGVEGRLQTDEYTNSAGQKTTGYSVVVNNFTFAESRNSQGAGSYDQGGYGTQGRPGGSYGNSFQPNASTYTSSYGSRSSDFAPDFDNPEAGGGNPYGGSQNYQQNNTGSMGGSNPFASSVDDDFGADDGALDIASDDLPF